MRSRRLIARFAHARVGIHAFFSGRGVFRTQQALRVAYEGLVLALGTAFASNQCRLRINTQVSFAKNVCRHVRTLPRLRDIHLTSCDFTVGHISNKRISCCLFNDDKPVNFAWTGKFGAQKPKHNCISSLLPYWPTRY